MKKVAQEEFEVNIETANQFLDWLSAEIGTPIRDANGRLIDLDGEISLDNDAVAKQATLRTWEIAEDSQTASISFYDKSPSATNNSLQDLLMTIGIELGSSDSEKSVFGFFIRAKLTEEFETGTETFARLLPGVLSIVDQAAIEGTDLAA